MNECQKLADVVCPFFQRSGYGKSLVRWLCKHPVFHIPGFPLQAASTARLSLIGFPTGAFGARLAAALADEAVFR